MQQQLITYQLLNPILINQLTINLIISYRFICYYLNN